MATTITLKQIPAGLYHSLKSSATKNHRSINSEVIAILENAFLSKKMSPEEFLTSARRLRERTKTHHLNEDFINRAKHEGRP